jgi:SAM-dependent methyltransferase
LKAQDVSPRPGYDADADLAAYLDRLVPPVSEVAYEGMAGYGFGRRYVAGKRVADLCWQEMGYGSRLLAKTAGSVTSMAVSAEAVEVASKALSAPNVRYEALDPSGLPYPDGHYDVVVALGLIEHLDRPEELVAEARRVLKRDGVLVVSFPDGQTSGNPGVTGLLDRHFEQVRLYRQGAVVGGMVSPASGEASEARLESVSLSPFSPHPGSKLPATTSVVAVCGSAGFRKGDEQPYVLLDRDRRVFDESADRAEDVEDLRDEIENMQRTEVQAFRDSLKLRDSEISYLRARVRRAEGKALRLETHIENMQRSVTWRIFEPYRRLRARIEVVRRSVPGVNKGNEDHR